MDFLGRMEEILLLAIWRLKDNAYAVPIIEEVKLRTGKSLSPGALWVSLDNLAKKGLVSKQLAESTPHIGGRGKLYYSLSKEGISALNEVRELHGSLWNDISDLSSDNT